jgi:HSP20 family protein
LWPDHPLLREGGIRPSVDVAEEGSAYVVEAELPGVKKENIAVNIGDNGQSVTIQGRIQQRMAQPAEETKSAQSDGPASSPTAEGGMDDHIVGSSTAEKSPVTQSQSTPLSTERYFAGDSTFTRTLWLPQEVDQSKVTAKLEDGILTLRLPKAEDKGSFKINVE